MSTVLQVVQTPDSLEPVSFRVRPELCAQPTKFRVLDRDNSRRFFFVMLEQSLEPMGVTTQMMTITHALSWTQKL